MLWRFMLQVHLQREPNSTPVHAIPAQAVLHSEHGAHEPFQQWQLARATNSGLCIR